MTDKELLMNQLTEILGKLNWQLVVFKDETSGDVLGALMGEELMVNTILENQHD